MLKNKEIIKLIFIEIVIFLAFLLFSILIERNNYNIYKKEIVKNNAYIISTLIEKYPDLESDIINSIITENKNYDEGLKILNKYGLDELDTIEYLKDNSKIKRKMLIINACYIIVFFGIILSVFLIYIRKMYNKINNLSSYIQKILNNDYQLDIREYEEGDLSNLKNNLYKVIIKLKTQSEISIKDKKELESTLSDISHQLKTPLTGMYVINELLYDDNLNISKKIELLNKNKSQLERVEWLVTSLLKLSRIESGTTILKKEKVEVLELIEKALEPIKVQLEIKNINVEINHKDKIYIQIDKNWTSEAILNIIKNSCEHSKENGKIIIDFEDNLIYTSIKITDNGFGISPTDLPHIFERFYKGKNHKSSSIGIGLNMSKKIVEAQNGNISVTSALGKGTSIIIKFYKKII